MANTLYTKDGKMHVIFGAEDFDKIIEDYLGSDFAKSIGIEISSRDIEIEELRTELDIAYDDEAVTLRDIRDEVDAVQEMLDSGRIAKKKLQDTLNRMYKIINDRL